MKLGYTAKKAEPKSPKETSRCNFGLLVARVKAELIEGRTLIDGRKVVDNDKAEVEGYKRV